MSDLPDHTIPVNVRLNPNETSAPTGGELHQRGNRPGPCLSGLGIHRAALLAAIAKMAKDGQPAPKGLEGHLVARVAMGVDVLARLQQQIQQILVGLREAWQRKPKTES